jgi:hypothetical protein
MDFDKFLRKYVWDEHKTPYLTPAQALTRRQAHYELAAYAVFLSILFGAVSLASLVGSAGPPRSAGAAVYAFTVVCAAIILGFSRNGIAAIYAGTAPLAAVVYLLVNGIRPDWGSIDIIAVTLFICIWMAYAWRVIRIGRRYESMDE